MSSRYFRSHKLLKSIVAIILLFIVLLVIFLEPLIKSLIEYKGSKELGRELKINGVFDIDWHWGYTNLHAEKIHLNNAPGYPETHMAEVDSLDVSFKPLKLLVGKLDLGQLSLQKPSLVLERKSMVDANWNFHGPQKPEANKDANDLSFPMIKNMLIKDGRVVYRDAVNTFNLVVSVNSINSGVAADTATQKENSAKRTIAVDGNGSIRKQDFLISASGGDLNALLNEQAVYPIGLQIEMGTTKVNVDGTLKDPLTLGGIDAKLTLSGHSMADLFYLTAIPLPITPPYRLNGRLTKNANTWGYSNFEGMVGNSDLSGNLSYDTGSERGFLKAKLLSNNLDSRDLGGFIGLSPASENAAPEQQQAAEAKKASPKLIPDVPLKLERLRTTDLDVSLQAIKLVAPGIPFKGVEVRFNLKDGLLNLDPFKVVLADGTVDGKIEIDAGRDVPPMKMNLAFHQLSLGQFFENTRFAKTTEGVFGGKVNLAGTGSSLADVLATSNGNMTIIMSGGKISLLLIEASDLDLAQALPLFLGKDKSTRIRCGVIDFDMKDGILNSKVVVLDTQDSLLIGNVGIDMKRETISAKLDAKPKDFSIFSAQIPLVVSGPLKAPAVGLDTKKAGSKGTAAAVLGSLLTPFAAILPFIEIGDAKNADCRALISNAGK